MSTHLATCPSCARHVRVNEETCPFCRASLPASFAARPAPRAVVVRLKRAALYALSASGLTLTSGCSEATTVAEYGGCPACGDDLTVDAGPDVTVGDAFFGPDAATVDAPVEAAPDAPLGADASDGAEAAPDAAADAGLDAMAALDGDRLADGGTE